MTTRLKTLLFSKKGGVLMLGSGVGTYNYTYNIRFQDEMNIVYPAFKKQSKKNPHKDNIVKVVSKTQLEFIIKKCYDYKKCL